jgi:uncharacterized membrane protein YdbT with pleckstrin-like domain
MSAPNRKSAKRSLREWWADPPRSGLQRLINPVVYRHLRGFGLTHLGGSAVAAVAGIICLSYAAYPWAALFLVIAALNVAAGYWYFTIAGDRSARA